MQFLGAVMGFLLFPGTPYALPAALSAPTVSLPAYSVTLTGYNAVPAQTDDSPFTTASGAYSNPEVVAARSRDLADKLPFGTIIEIDGPTEPSKTCGYGVVAPLVGYRVIADTMNARYTDHIDVLFSMSDSYKRTNGKSTNASDVLGVCASTTVRVVGFVNISKPSNLPKTQAALASLISSSTPTTPLALK